MKALARAEGLAALLVFCFLQGGDMLRFSRIPLEMGSMGLEYANIAVACVTRGQFADAMGPASGPSAWMPPGLCWLIALVFSLSGAARGDQGWENSVTLAALLLIKNTSLTGGWWLIARTIRQTWGLKGLGRWMALTAAWLALDPTLHREFHDTWFTNSWVSLILVGLLRPPQRATPGLLGLALALPLCHPVLAAASALATRIAGWPRKVWMAALAAACLSGGLWMTRNQLVLQRPYPIKSNLWFDFALANYWDDDGLVTWSTLYQYHPVGQNLQHREYCRQGEVVFLEQARKLPVSAGEWAQRTLRRAGNALIYSHSDQDFWPAFQVPAKDLQTCLKAGLMVERQGQAYWLYCGRDLHQELETLNLESPELVMRSHQVAALQWRKAHQGLHPLAVALFFSLGPALAVACLWLDRRQLAQPGERAAWALYLAYLVPYVLVQHHARYQSAVALLQMFLMLRAWIGPPPSRAEAATRESTESVI